MTEVCMDMSPAFIKGAEENFPKVSITHFILEHAYSLISENFHS
nr:transposase [Paenibacillus sp. DMB20]